MSKQDITKDIIGLMMAIFFIAGSILSFTAIIFITYPQLSAHESWIFVLCFSLFFLFTLITGINLGGFIIDSVEPDFILFLLIIWFGLGITTVIMLHSFWWIIIPMWIIIVWILREFSLWYNKH